MPVGASAALLWSDRTVGGWTDPQGLRAALPESDLQPALGRGGDRVTLRKTGQQVPLLSDFQTLS